MMLASLILYCIGEACERACFARNYNADLACLAVQCKVAALGCGEVVS